MNNLWRAGISVAILSLAISTVAAQQQRGGGGGGVHTLAANKSVQEELKLTDDQKTKVEELTKKTQESITEKTKDLTGQELRTKRTEVMKEINPATEKALAGILKDDQTKRFKQIQVQQQGPRAFTNEANVKALKVSDDQAKELKDIVDEGQKKITSETQTLTRQDGAKRREITTKVNKETMEKVTGKLTDEQKKAWKELAGEPFEVKRNPQ